METLDRLPLARNPVRSRDARGDASDLTGLNLEVRAHFSRGDLFSRLITALMEDGVNPLRPSVEALAPYDQMHGCGLEATAEVAKLMEAGPSDHVLDVGSGIGGPARYFATRLGCSVTGVDLVAEFCAVARLLTRLLKLEEKVAFQTADALAMPFADGCFDGACAIGVSMNVADKGALYREIRRVLKPGARLVLSEIAKGRGPEVDYPTPWAPSARASFLSTPEETCRHLLRAGFLVHDLRDTSEQARGFDTRTRALVGRGRKPPYRATSLIHGAAACQASLNASRAIAQGRIIPIIVVGSRPA